MTLHRLTERGYEQYDTAQQRYVFVPSDDGDVIRLSHENGREQLLTLDYATRLARAIDEVSKQDGTAK